MHCSEQNASVCATPTSVVIIAMHILAFSLYLLASAQQLHANIRVRVVRACESGLAWLLAKTRCPKHARITTEERNELTFTTF